MRLFVNTCTVCTIRFVQFVETPKFQFVQCIVCCLIVLARSVSYLFPVPTGTDLTHWTELVHFRVWLENIGNFPLTLFIRRSQDQQSNMILAMLITPTLLTMFIWQSLDQLTKTKVMPITQLQSLLKPSFPPTFPVFNISWSTAVRNGRFHFRHQRLAIPDYPQFPESADPVSKMGRIVQHR